MRQDAKLCRNIVTGHTYDENWAVVVLRLMYPGLRHENGLTDEHNLPSLGGTYLSLECADSFRKGVLLPEEAERSWHDYACQ